MKTNKIVGLITIDTNISVQQEPRLTYYFILYDGSKMKKLAMKRKRKKITISESEFPV